MATFGYLYNWFAVSEKKGLCPAGWHVPADAEWTALIQFIDPSLVANRIQSNVAGGKMKSIGSAYWNSPNTGATNSSGFSALPGGYRHIRGNFVFIRNNAIFWSATENDDYNAWNRILNNDAGIVYKGDGYKENGASVRCLKD
ncbi:MAG: fibrobacter succinogenes major paralogous domain-containing protein [Saprospiraceae bacterium]